MKKPNLAVFLLSIALLTSLSCFAAEPIGLIMNIEGTATATDSQGNTRQLATRAKVFLNDTIITGEKSKLQIVFKDDTLFSQGENSEMQLDQYAYNPDKQTENRFKAKLKAGIFRVITGKIPLINKDQFEMQTRRTTIGIRGCEVGFQTDDTEDRVVVMEVSNGKKIFITPFKGLNQLIVTVPSMVTINNAGEVEESPLSVNDPFQIQQATTLHGGGGGEQGGGEQGGGEQGGGDEQGGGEQGGGDTGWWDLFDPDIDDQDVDATRI